jgi:hypothetical protein
LNVQIGNGHGKSGGISKRHFGCVSWNKTKNRFQACFSLPKDRCAKRDRSGRRKANQVKALFKTIEEAYAFILKNWEDHKNEPNYQGYKDPKSLQHYKNYLGNKYEELNFLLSEN